MPSWRARSVMVSGLLLVACESSTEICACTVGPPLAVVYGDVQLASGGPAVGAVVTAYIARADGCVARPFPDGQTQALADGHYSLGVVSASDTSAICVLRLAFRQSPPTDSAKVDATLGGP